MDDPCPASRAGDDSPQTPRPASEQRVTLPTIDVGAINDRAAKSLAHWNAARQIALDREHRQVADEALVKRRYWWNFALLIGAVLLAWLLSLRHLEHWLAQSLVIGLPVTALTLWQVVRDWVPGPLSEKGPALSQRILRHPRALEWLVLAVVILTLANGCTSSLYVTHSGGSSPPAEISLTTGRQPFGENLRVSATQPVQGRPEFFQIRRLWSPVEVQLQAIEPHGFEVKPEAQRQVLYPWSRIRVSFPGDFRRIDYYVIRILPGKNLQAIRPKVIGKETPSSYTLRLEVNGKEVAKTDMTYDCFYFGADRSAVEELRKGEPAAERASIIRDHLTALSHTGTNLQNRTDSLTGSFRFVETPALQPGMKVRVVVNGETSSGSKEEVVKPEPNKVQNLVIEINSP